MTFKNTHIAYLPLIPSAATMTVWAYRYIWFSIETVPAPRLQALGAVIATNLVTILVVEAIAAERRTREERGY